MITDASGNIESASRVQSPRFAPTSIIPRGVKPRARMSAKKPTMLPISPPRLRYISIPNALSADLIADLIPYFIQLVCPFSGVIAMVGLELFPADAFVVTPALIIVRPGENRVNSSDFFIMMPLSLELQARCSSSGRSSTGAR